MPDRYIILRVVFRDCGDYQATKLADQLVDVATAIGDENTIIAEGIVGDDDDQA